MAKPIFRRRRAQPLVLGEFKPIDEQEQPFHQHQQIGPGPLPNLPQTVGRATGSEFFLHLVKRTTGVEHEKGIELVALRTVNDAGGDASELDVHQDKDHHRCTEQREDFSQRQSKHAMVLKPSSER